MNWIFILLFSSILIKCSIADDCIDLEYLECLSDAEECDVDNCDECWACNTPNGGSGCFIDCAGDCVYNNGTHYDECVGPPAECELPKDWYPCSNTDDCSTCYQCSHVPFDFVSNGCRPKRIFGTYPICVHGDGTERDPYKYCWSHSNLDDPDIEFRFINKPELLDGCNWCYDFCGWCAPYNEDEECGKFTLGWSCKVDPLGRCMGYRKEDDKGKPIFEDVPCVRNDENQKFCEKQGYVYHDDEIGKTWQEARDICISEYHSDLVSISTIQEFQCLLNIIDGSSPWIGLSFHEYRDYTHFFTNVDGTPCPTENNGCLGSDYWKIGRPLKCGVGSKCVRILPEENRINNDIECDETLTAFLCNPIGSGQGEESIMPFPDDINNNNYKYYSIFHSKTAFATVMTFGGIIILLLLSYSLVCYWCVCNENKKTVQ